MLPPGPRVSIGFLKNVSQFGPAVSPAIININICSTIHMTYLTDATYDACDI